MSITWTKNFSSSNDGDVLTGGNLGDLQSDINSNAVNITDNQTIAGTKYFSGQITLQGAMPYVVRRLASSSVNVSSGATLLYTVSTSTTAIITAIVIRSPSTNISDGTDFDFGSTTLASNWVQSVSFATLTSNACVLVVTPASNVSYAASFTAGSTFYIKASAGTTLNSTATVDVIGYTF